MHISRIIKKLQIVDDYSALLLADIRSFLSDRQYRVVKLKKQGYKNIEIADKLEVSPSTITKEIKLIKEKVKRYIRK